jgi:sucrose-6F-phosphate phosphohydrolase
LNRSPKKCSGSRRRIKLDVYLFASYIIGLLSPVHLWEENMTQLDRWLFVSDVDYTLLGDDAALSRLAPVLKAAGDHLITAYNSSRPCASLRQTLADTPHLPTPDYLIGALGTEIQLGPSAERLTDYSRHLHRDWQRDQIAALMSEFGFSPQAPEFQTPYKASYDAPDPIAYEQVLQRLENAGLKAKVIFSGGKNLDIIPCQAGKGAVIEYLCQRLNIRPERVVVAGDSANDLEMFVVPYKGIVVANADSELKQRQGDHIYHARLTYAGGVLEGLHFWQVC